MPDGCTWCRYDACCKMLQKALVYYRKSSQVLSAARAERALGTVLQTMARLSEAEPLLRNALGVFKAQAAEGVEVAVSYDCLASLQAAPVSSRARASRASRLLARASTQPWTCTAALRASSRRANPSMELSPGRSLLQISKGELPEAHESLQLALAICDRELDTTSPVLGDVLYRLGCVHLMLRDRKDSLESSEKFLQRALAIAEQQCAARVASWHSAAAAVGPPFARNECRRDRGCACGRCGDAHPDVARVLCRLGALYIEMDQYTEADASFGRALRIREDALGPSHARVAQTLKHMINLYELQVGPSALCARPSRRGFYLQHGGVTLGCAGALPRGGACCAASPADHRGDFRHAALARRDAPRPHGSARNVGEGLWCAAPWLWPPCPLPCSSCCAAYSA